MNNPSINANNDWEYSDPGAHATDPYLIEPQQPCILMIEDNRSDVHYLTTYLQKLFGRDAFYYHDVPRLIEAFQLMDNTSVDLIFLDLSLLDITGSATVAALHAEAPNIPIIIYSGSDNPRLRDEAIQCGAKEYMVKGHENDIVITRMVQNSLPTLAY